MEMLRRTTEEEMVLSFLRAERHSPRWKDLVASGIDGRWYLLDQPDLGDKRQNDDRRRVLGYRGYGKDELLFRGFPDSVDWWLVQLARSEVTTLMFGRGICDELTEGTRLVSIAAKNASAIECRTPGAPSLNESIFGVVKLDADGVILDPLVVVATSSTDQHILVEGYARACAYASRREGPDVEAFAGYGSNMVHWQFWGLD